jgi:hypothetical protein
VNWVLQDGRTKITVADIEGIKDSVMKWERMGKLATLVLKGKSKAPKKCPPNAIYEQLDDTGTVRSRKFYDENDYPFSRQDFDPSHGGMQPHEHQREPEGGMSGNCIFGQWGIDLINRGTLATYHRRTF